MSAQLKDISATLKQLEEPDLGLHAISCTDLLAMEFEELHWNIEGILPAGTMLLFGKPKKGKSFLTLMMAISVAAGRAVFGKTTSGCDVLYMGLEDSTRRLQRRLKGCANALGISPAEFSEKMAVKTLAKRIDTGLIEELQQWMQFRPNTGLIVVDMLKKVTAATSGKNLYEEQAQVGDALTKFSHLHPGLSIIVVHHSRKAESDDPFDLVSGTTGLSGSHDSLAAIADDLGNRTLHITGRDVEGSEIPLLMNERGMYTLQPANPADHQQDSMSDTRRKVFDAVSSSMPYTRQQIIGGCKLSGASVDKQLRNLMRDGLIHKPEYGKYQKTGKRFFDEAIVDLTEFVGGV